MKIKKVTPNNRKKCFEIQVAKASYDFPYSRLSMKLSAQDAMASASIDQDLGGEGFVAVTLKGHSESVHIDQILEYARDPEYIREMLLYKLTLRAQKILAQGKVSKREVIRRMDTSPTQFYRLLDQTYYGKSIDQMVKLLTALDCPVDVVFSKAA